MKFNEITLKELPVTELKLVDSTNRVKRGGYSISFVVDGIKEGDVFAISLPEDDREDFYCVSDIGLCRSFWGWNTKERPLEIIKEIKERGNMIKGHND